jgi:hypothetical protein
VQVRLPIYTSGIGAWRTFADALASLHEAMQTELKMVYQERSGWRMADSQSARLRASDAAHG